MIIIPVEIDTGDITKQFDVSKSQIETILDNIAKGLAMSFVGQLEVNVGNTLNSTRNRFLRNIRVIDSGKLESTVLLDYSKDPLIKMIEEGSGPFDMKTGLLGSNKVKYTSKGKRYITVPFRWAASTSVGESDVFTSKLPQSIHTIVSKKTAGSTLKLSEIPSSLSSKSTRQPIVDSEGKTLFDSYTHKNSVYEGITKSTDIVTKQNRYFSFRRVSEQGSDPNSWIHPGMTAQKFMENTMKDMNIGETVGILIDQELSKLGF